MKQAKKLLALFLAAAMLTGTLASCNNNSGETSGTESSSENSTPDEGEKSDTLLASSNHFEGKFSPFFAASAEDINIMNMTQISLLGTARVGAIVENGIEGET